MVSKNESNLNKVIKTNKLFHYTLTSNVIWDVGDQVTEEDAHMALWQLRLPQDKGH